jgi:hypothetical protein
MIKIKLIVLFALFNLTVFSQSSIEILENAYLKFEQGKYKQSIKLFEDYYKQNEGNRTDYYFTCVAYAQTNKIKKSLHYTEMAATGMETYGMMLADSLLQPIHKYVLPWYQSLREFHVFCDSLDFYKRHLKYPVYLNKVDSVYKKLPSRKVSAFLLSEIANRYNKQKDSLKALFYLKEIVFGRNFNWLFEENVIGDALGKFEDDFPVFYATQLSFLKEWKDATNNFYMSGYSGDPDSTLAFYKKLISIAPTGFMPFIFYYNISCSYSIKGDYAKAAHYLLKAINDGYFQFNHLFRDKDLIPLFESDEGQPLLRYIISKACYPEIQNADLLFPFSGKGDESGRRMMYEYLKSKNFNAYIPEGFDIYKNETDKDTDIVYVSHFRTDKFTENELNCIFSTDKVGHIKIIPVRDESNENFFSVQAVDNDLNRMVLLKKTNNPKYADRAGNCFIFPKGNMPFFNDVKSGKIQLSKIPLIQRRYLIPLLKYKIKERMFVHTTSNLDRYSFIDGWGYLHIAGVYNELFAETDPLELMPLLNYNSMKIRRTPPAFEKMIKTIRDTSYYLSLDKEDKLKYQKVIENTDSYGEKTFFSETDGRNTILFPELPKGQQWNNDFKEEEYVKDLAKFGNAYQKWWDTYKKENPFNLPPLAINLPPVQKQIDIKSDNLYIENVSTPPVFYDLGNKDLYIGDSIFRLNSSKYLNTKVVNTKSYIFAAGARVYDSNFFCIQNDKPETLELLTEIADTLNIQLEKRNPVKSWSQQTPSILFSVYNVFNNIFYFWFDNDSLCYSNIQSAKKDLLSKKVLHKTYHRTFANDTTVFLEIPTELNSMDAKQVGGNLFLLCNLNVNYKPYSVKSNSQKIYLFKMDSTMKITNKITIGEELNNKIGYLGETKVSIIEANENLFICIGKPSEYGEGYYQVFNKELIPQSEIYRFSDSFKKITRLNPSIVIINKKVYAIYVANENQENFLKITELSESGNPGTFVYLQKIDGDITDQKALKDENNNIRYCYIERVEGKLFYKYITIDLNELNFN